MDVSVERAMVVHEGSGHDVVVAIRLPDGSRRMFSTAGLEKLDDREAEAIADQLRDAA